MLAREQVQRVMEGNLPDQFAVRELGDNHWIHLFAMADAGRVSHRYVGGCAWQPLQ
jgi:hypothetical protein